MEIENLYDKIDTSKQIAANIYYRDKKVYNILRKKQ